MDLVWLSLSREVRLRPGVGVIVLTSGTQLIGSGLLVFVATAALAQNGSKTELGHDTASNKIVQRIDQVIDNKARDAGWSLADACSDSSFIRRAYLDLTGTQPRAAEVVEFMDDPASSKRQTLVNRLLNSPAHADHLAATWTAWLTPERDDQPLLGTQQNGLRIWLRNRFAENLRYDRLVADMLVATGSPQSGPTSFFVALDREPKKIAAQTARVFMGIQLDCAECHDHPFDKWKQRDFWGYAAYFARISASDEMTAQNAEVLDRDSGEVTLPNTEEVIAPQPLVSTDQSIAARGTRRQQLTLWLTTRDNPFLARATVNRVWSLLMGRGLIEPIDDMRSPDLATHPELLDELSVYFTETGYDLRKLFLAIVSTRAYSRDTRLATAQPPEELFAVMLTKPLSERQLASSVAEVSRQLGEQNQQLQQALSRQLGKIRGEASQSKLGIVNALVTLHGEILNEASSDRSSRLLKALQAPYLDQRGKVRWLFLTSLNRLPTAEEDQQLSSYLNGISGKENVEGDSAAGSANSAQSDLQWQSDLLWALLNSSEFAMTP
jgi:Protein of unknown function (DUF1549)/Protein of unknown function (DUF1553)